ncbi:MAG: hypothetical protein HDR15_14885 [Lachnospiraceae bacterium]|nr:hypothetical protein [Lachnospiraceae bacterium]
MSKKRMIPVILQVLNLLLILLLFICVKKNVETHVEGAADVKAAWCEAEVVGGMPLRYESRFLFRPQNRYLDHVECILTELPENASGGLRVEIYEGMNLSEKCVARNSVGLSEVTEGEWQSIPLQVWLSPSKTYLMLISIYNTEAEPRLVYVDSTFPIAEYIETIRPEVYLSQKGLAAYQSEQLSSMEDPNQPLIAYCYGRQVSPVLILTTLTLIIGVNAFLIYQWIKRDHCR